MSVSRRPSTTMTHSSDNSDDADISDRKTDHLELTASEEVEAKGKTTLLHEVELHHDSLPELATSDIDLSTQFVGKQLDAPLLITGMTGGADRAKEINEILASVAQELGLAFGVGSQRAMLDDPDLRDTYDVRDIAPDVPLLGNIGAVQAVEYPASRIADAAAAIDADALCVHLNPGQEMIQPEGDRDFRGCVDAIDTLVETLDIPVIAKETGAGLSPQTLEKLQTCGVDWVDTSGAGGTTWIGVETLRKPKHDRTVGELFWDWGTPTAASIVYATRRDFQVIGSGGLRSGLDAARAIALGASLAGMALPWLKAAYNHGRDKALSFGNRAIDALQTACVLTGSPDLDGLRDTPRHIGPDLAHWIDRDED